MSVDIDSCLVQDWWREPWQARLKSAPIHEPCIQQLAISVVYISRSLRMTPDHVLFSFLVASHDASPIPCPIAAMPKLLITGLEREDLKRRHVGIAEWQSRRCSKITLLKVRQVTHERR